MRDFSFEVQLQEDGSYIMAVNGEPYYCRDWQEVVEKYHEITEGDGNVRKEENRSRTYMSGTQAIYSRTH